MKRVYSLVILFLFSFLPLFSQTNGNEWIHYDQPYFRIKITQAGIYRIDKNSLINAEFPVGIDPKRIQLFGKEQEIPIYVKGESDGQFDDEDFIEFYAEGNDGWLDSLLYADPEAMLNPKYSLYNDTLFYYLSYSPPDEIPNLRTITANDQNFDGFIGSEYCLVKQKVVFNQNYHFGIQNLSNGVTDPRYLNGEGYGKFITNGSQSFVFNSEQRYSSASAPPSILKTTFASANNPNTTNPSGNHHFRLSENSTVLFDSVFFAYKTFPLTLSLSTQTLTNSTQFTLETVNDIGISNDKMVIAYAEFTFPHNFNFENNENFLFYPKGNNNQKLKVVFSNFQGTAPVVYSLGSNATYRSTAFQDGSQYRFLVPQNGEDYFTCFMSSYEAIQSITNIEKIDGLFTDFTSLDFSDAFLIISHPKLMESAQAYKAYRDQDFNCRIINVEELYDQYGGGIAKHPLAIKRFLKDLIDHGQVPSNLFLLGKSISPTGKRTDLNSYALDLVPTIGYPPSDNLLSAGLNGTEIQPAIPTGRLAAQDNEDVLAYLDKVMAFEAQEAAMWMKNALHFGGGANANEQNTFEGYLSSYETIIEDTSMGASVYTYLKNSSTPIEIIVNEQITELINGGVSLMTFFGHANGSGFDINIDQPENYENYGKYPMILASSCYTGNIHQAQASNSEHFVLIPEKGSIAYLATVSTGLPDYLNLFNQKFYKHSFQSHYNSSIGQNIIRAIEDVPDNPIFPYLKESTCLEMTLHGDPSLVLNAFEKPDMAISENEVFFSPEILTADVDSFDVSIVLKNLGRATHQHFDVELIRHFPGNLGDSIYFKELSGLLNFDTLTFTLASHHPFSDGINTFDILVDYSAAQIDELDDFGNNVIYGKEFVVKSSQIVPIYPYDQSIIASPSPIFSAFAGNLDSTMNNYHFQLSQEVDFSSIIDQGVVNQSDGVIFWEPATVLSDHQVYFWRTAIEADIIDNNWRTSSFEYINDSTGWGQSVPDQFKANSFQLLNYDAELNELSFIQGSKELNCQLLGSRHVNENQVLLDLNLVDYGGCPGGPYIFVMVFDPNTLEAWGTNFGGANPDHDFGNVICNSRGRVEYFFAFNQNDAAQIASLYTMLNNEIPEDYHVLIYTYSIAKFQNWSAFEPQLFNLLSDWGSNINVTTPDLPFIFYTQIGNNTVTEEIIGTNAFDTLNLSLALPIIGNTGKVHIPDMGKTHLIKAAEWSFSGQSNGDEFNLQVNDSETNASLINSSLVNFDQTISIASDPNHQLFSSISIKDTLNFSPIQFDYFRLFYDPLGDAAINPNFAFNFTKDTLSEGENLKLLMGLTNPSPFPMDSLLIRLSIVNKQNQLKYLDDHRIAPLAGMVNLIDTVELPTLGLSGENRLIYELNPLDNMGLADQAEENRFNNKSSMSFYVLNDLTDPVVDVTFDGIHIMNGEIISPSPRIMVQLKDNSEYLVFSELADTTNLSIFLKTAQGTIKKIHYNDPKLTYEFGNQQNNHLKVLYRPEFESNGKYTLLVQAKDKSDNTSGTSDYEIEFEIIRESAITQVLNYPNPFVDRTYFVFTLTGTRIPDVFTIRIYTATGKIVKEIHKAELGPLRIGNNITDYYWDGTDNYGDRLANGVYFYKVDIQYYDDQLQHIETDADRYFKQGMGKMYLMR